MVWCGDGEIEGGVVTCEVEMEGGFVVLRGYVGMYLGYVE